MYPTVIIKGVDPTIITKGMDPALIFKGMDPTLIAKGTNPIRLEMARFCQVFNVILVPSRLSTYVCNNVLVLFTHKANNRFALVFYPSTPVKVLSLTSHVFPPFLCKSLPARISMNYSVHLFQPYPSAILFLSDSLSTKSISFHHPSSSHFRSYSVCLSVDNQQKMICLLSHKPNLENIFVQHRYKYTNMYTDPLACKTSLHIQHVHTPLLVQHRYIYQLPFLYNIATDTVTLARTQPPCLYNIVTCTSKRTQPHYLYNIDTDTPTRTQPPSWNNIATEKPTRTQPPCLQILLQTHEHVHNPLACTSSQQTHQYAHNPPCLHNIATDIPPCTHLPCL